MSYDQRIVKFTNCRLLLDDQLVWRDLWVSGASGRILNHQKEFFDQHAAPTEVHDLRGRIVSPGFVDVQLNGGFGFDFSVPSEHYGLDFKAVNRKLVETGVTSYLPTLTSQKSEVYYKTLPFLAAPKDRVPEDGAESLGAHCEGPFINPLKNGIHKRAVLQKPTSIEALEACYGSENMNPVAADHPPTIKMVTIATELDESHTVIPTLHSRGIVPSVGHSTATYAQMCQATDLGATMITHLFNAMSEPHHRTPGIFGVLGSQQEEKEGQTRRRPWFGLIADGIHVHPSMVRVAYNAHPDGCILVTDAMSVLGLPDGDYVWTNGEVIEKRGGKVTLKGTEGTIAGSCITLLSCLTNLIHWADLSIPIALNTVTSTPAAMLGVGDVKGTLRAGADADLVILGEGRDARGAVTLSVDEVWKFGVRVYRRRVGDEIATTKAATATAKL